MYPENLLYSKEHEWLKDNEDGTYTVGITDYAQSELGDIVYVEMPDVGNTFAADDEVCTVESVKAVSEIYTPIAGEIIAVNEALDDSPELVNDSPHESGWIFKVRSAGPPHGLMSAEQYQAFINANSG